MKQIQYYALMRNSGYRIIGVTSESGRWRINGRYIDHDEPTHTTKRELIGRFDTLEKAQAKIDGIKTICDNYRPLIVNARNKVRDLLREEAAEIDKLLGVE